MRRTDRALLAIVAGVLLLIIIAVVVVLARPQPGYLSETGPDNIAFNYLLALRRGDTARAYGYLAPTLPGYPPSAADFTADLARMGSDTGSAYEVLGVTTSGDRAVVVVRTNSFSQGGLLSSGQSSRRFTMTLAEEAGVWRLVDSDDWLVWSWCWGQQEGC